MSKLKNNENLLTLMQENFFTIGVRFVPYDKKESRIYVYKVPNELSLNVKVGDYVVVNVRREPGTYYVVLVEEVHDTPQIKLNSDAVYQWIISPVDFTHFNRMQELETNFTAAMLEIERERVKEDALADFFATKDKLDPNGQAFKMFSGLMEQYGKAQLAHTRAADVRPAGIQHTASDHTAIKKWWDDQAPSMEGWKPYDQLTEANKARALSAYYLAMDEQSRRDA